MQRFIYVEKMMTLMIQAVHFKYEKGSDNRYHRTGWKPKVDLKQGIELAYNDFKLDLSKE